MTQSQTAPLNEGLLPPGTIVELEIYYCVVHMPERGEIHTITVTCDTLKKMQVVDAVALASVFVDSGIEIGSQQSYAELARVFQLQCSKEDSAKLLNLHWGSLLDRRLLSIVKLEIQPTQGGAS